jgi:hypothetical protein
VASKRQRLENTMTAHELQARRTRLLQRSAVLRQQAACELQKMEPVFVVGDRLLQGWTWLRRNPGYLAGALAVLVVLRPRAVLRTTVRAWTLWQSLKRARGWIARTR